MDENINGDPKSKSITGFLKSGRFLKPFLGIVLGGTGGFLYFYFVGCKTGTCPITSNPWGSIAAGAVLGFLITGMFDKN